MHINHQPVYMKRRPIRRCAFLLPVLMFIATATTAQHLPDSTISRIDALFQQWNHPDAPGCVAGIVQGDQLVYSKGFGLAALENKTPNTPESIYYMCSVSKQFAGYAVALLVNQGKLKLDDDIHTYLPWMQDFGQTITVRHLLGHTSGIRDDIGMAQLYGLNMDGMLTQDLAIKILAKQHSLNFIPGEKFSYSNSNYVLLSEIVKTVSHQSFRAFADSAIFQPLSMTHTHFVDDPTELIPGRAPSYIQDKGLWKNATDNVYTMGDGGLFTNITDMAKWVMNCWSPASQQVVAQWATTGQLNNGKVNTYAMGIDVTTYRGQKRYIHNGGLAGYRTMVVAYPELKTGIIVFGNAGDGAVYGKADQIANLLIPDRSSTTKDAVTEAPKSITIDSMMLRAYTGDYIADNGYLVPITLKDGKLYAGGTLELAAIDYEHFYVVKRPAIKYQFDTNERWLPVRVNLSSPVLDKPLPLIKASHTPVKDKQLSAYTGTYYSDELDCYFTITLKNHALVISNSRLGESPVECKGSEHLYTQYDLPKHLQVHRNEKRKIIGLDANNGGIMNLFFEKIK